MAVPVERAGASTGGRDHDLLGACGGEAQLDLQRQSAADGQGPGRRAPPSAPGLEEIAAGGHAAAETKRPWPSQVVTKTTRPERVEKPDRGHGRRFALDLAHVAAHLGQLQLRRGGAGEGQENEAEGPTESGA